MEDGIVMPWTGHSATVTVVNANVHSGKHSLKVTDRLSKSHGVTQAINLEAGRSYKFKAFVKQLDGQHGNLNFDLFETYLASIIYTWSDNGQESYNEIALRPMVRFGSGWHSLEGDHTVSFTNFTSARLLIHGPEADIDFLLDDVTLQEVNISVSWETDAKERIEKIRKSTVHIQVVHPPSLIPEDIEIQVDQKRHLFGFGCRVNQDWIVDPDYKEYQDIFFKMFNWATMDGFEWNKNRGTEQHPNYTAAVRALDELIRHGVNVRGHALFWGMPGKSPDWVEALDGPALKTAIQRRIKFITGITHRKIKHWDIYNELLHGQLYEEATGDPNFSQGICNLTHVADYSPLLFLNDFDVVATGAGTKAYVDIARKFRDARVGLYGLGAQSHFNSEPNADFLKEHLDDLARTHFHLWISELSVYNRDPYIRAEWLYKALLVYFSHPAVEGISLDGFWDHDTNVNSSLVNGSTFKVNAAGSRFVDLLLREWSTHVTFNLSAGPVVPVKAFHGDYDVTVHYKGRPIMKGSFQLEPHDMVYKISIHGTEQNIHVPTTVDPFHYSTHNMHIGHVAPIEIGNITSGANNSDLQCTTRWSPLSDFGVAAETHVHCADDEVLTGCSSLHKSLDWLRGGEDIELRSAKISCSAKSLKSSSAGVYAVARCCKSSGITCNYWHASSKTVNGDEEMETDCQLNYLPTGCSVRNRHGEITEASPSVNHHGCSTHKPKDANLSLYGVCCKAPFLSCTSVKSKESGLRQGDNATTTCGTGYVMTSCNVNSYSGRTAGAFFEVGSDGKDYCTSTNGDDKNSSEGGVISVAVCCKLNKVGTSTGVGVPVIG